MPRDLEGGDFTAGKDGGLPFIEAIEYARSRKVELAVDYYGNAIKAHRAKATTITGAASVAQIRAVMDQLNDVLAEGGTFADWKSRADVEALMLPEHRLDNIFRTNVQAAYNRGRYQQQQTSIVRTFWMYDAINDSRVRPSHLAMDGVIRPRDDEWWSTRYPPNGYRCRCSVIALSQAQVEARGGVTVDLPADATPDPGWNYNPGADYTAPDATILAAASDGSARAARALAEARAAAERMNLSYADLNRLGIESLQRDIRTAGGDWEGRDLPARLSDQQAIRVHGLFVEQLARLSAGPAHDFAIKASSAGVAPKKLIPPIRQFLGRLPQTWQKRIADALRSRPLTVEDGIKASGNRKRGFFAPSLMRLVAAHDETNVIIHESAHLLQAISPDLDTFFQAHHRERTAGDILESLKDRNPTRRYEAWEVTRPDKYFSDYVGKEYLPRSQHAPSVAAIKSKANTDAFRGAALELMSMTFEGAFTSERKFTRLLVSDPRLLAVLYGLLFHY